MSRARSSSNVQLSGDDASNAAAEPSSSLEPAPPKNSLAVVGHGSGGQGSGGLGAGHGSGGDGSQLPRVDVVILCGASGGRLVPGVGAPLCLLPLANHPCLAYLLASLHRQGFASAVLVTVACFKEQVRGKPVVLKRTLAQLGVLLNRCLSSSCKGALTLSCSHGFFIVLFHASLSFLGARCMRPCLWGVCGGQLETFLVEHLGAKPRHISVFVVPEDCRGTADALLALRAEVGRWGERGRKIITMAMFLNIEVPRADTRRNVE